MSLDEAATLAGITALRKTSKQDGLTPSQRLERIESGAIPISHAQFKALAKIYRRPEVTFFLPYPPKRENLLADFRTVESYYRSSDSPEFSALKRHILNLHKGLIDLATEEEMSPLPFVGSVRSDDSPAAIVAAIKDTLGPDPRSTQRINDEQDLFSAIREQAQNKGIFVILQGNLGSHHSNITLEEFRGISIANPLVPLIVVNPNDTLKARVFSLLHELCHIFLGITGVCNNGIATIVNSRQQERLCNAVAAEYLVPLDRINQFSFDDTTPQHIDAIAKTFKVSGLVVARRALDLGRITQDDYVRLSNIYIGRCLKAKAKAKSSKDGRGGPDPNVVAAFNLGNKLLSTVINAANSGKIGFSEASSLLRLPFSRLDKVYR
ncbi:DNA-binding protein [Desulfovibrio desulfuricans]|nr:DNA-binding protein [Desulfovibrio desulfuricans]